MNLPFLDDHKWPISKEPEERVVNPSYDKQLQDHLVEELLSALKSHDHKGVVSCLAALSSSFQNEDISG